MIQKVVAAAIRFRSLVLLAALMLVAGGLFAFKQLNIEAYPNPVSPLVEVIAQPQGLSSEDVERLVTIPLEIGLSGMRGIEHMRSQSLFGLSDVKCYFNWDTDYWAARQEVINRLQFVSLPDGVSADISPWNAIGELYRYEIVAPGYSLKDIKATEDWTLEKLWKQVPGVIDVTSYGGETKQYQVEVDPFRLRGHNVTLTQLQTAIQNANQNTGGQRLKLGEQSYDVRAQGLLQTTHDIENIVLSEQKGVPVRVRDVANTNIGFAPRLGMVGRDETPDIVQGIVLMRYGGETKPTLDGIHQKVDDIRRLHLLPPDVDIKPYYDRGDLVKLTTHTVFENLIVGMMLVAIVLFLFLGSMRAALITALNIPLALLMAFIGLTTTHTSANLISLGAVDFGIVVDSTVIMIENIFRHLGLHGQGRIKERVLAAAREVGGPMAFSTVIIGVAFLPLFTMTGVAGVIFAPMARTYAFAIGGAVVLALALTPVLVCNFVPANTEEKETPMMRGLHWLYKPVFDMALRRPRLSILLAAIPISLCVVLFPFLGREFLPKLEEGNLWIRATLPTSIAFETSSQYVGKMRRIVRGCPKDPNVACTDANRKLKMVKTVVSQLGRPDDGTDVTGFYNIELFAPLEPFDTWPHGMTKDKLVDELSRELESEFPGTSFNFSQYINDNVEEALSGVKGENSVKVFSPDVRSNEHIAQQVVDVMSSVKGVADLGMLPSLGQPNVLITPDRVVGARYGLNVGDIEATVRAAVGGQAITQVYEGEKRFDLTIRWLPSFRESLSAIRSIMVATPDGTTIPLGQIAKVERVDSALRIFRENGMRDVPVKFSVRGRDLASTIAEAQAKIAARVHLPYDAHLEWSGQINELNEAEARLKLIVPITLLVIIILAYGAVKNWIDTLIVMINIPVACTGGLLALLLTGVNFSVSAAMGFISIFGIAIQDAILVVTYFQRLKADGRTIENAAREAAEKRLRPVLMTTLVAMIGLLPAALSQGIGAQAQKPLAIVVIGGSLMLAIMPRILQPPLLVVAHRFMARHSKKSNDSNPDDGESSIHTDLLSPEVGNT